MAGRFSEQAGFLSRPVAGSGAKECWGKGMLLWGVAGSGAEGVRPHRGDRYSMKCPHTTRIIAVGLSAHAGPPRGRHTQDQLRITFPVMSPGGEREKTDGYRRPQAQESRGQNSRQSMPHPVRGP
jgi:hypothetical protein